MSIVRRGTTTSSEQLHTKADPKAKPEEATSPRIIPGGRAFPVPASDGD
jgi:hypothetical protein